MLIVTDTQRAKVYHHMVIACRELKDLREEIEQYLFKAYWYSLDDWLLEREMAEGSRMERYRE